MGVNLMIFNKIGTELVENVPIFDIRNKYENYEEKNIGLC
jgi:hypothetical protein